MATRTSTVVHPFHNMKGQAGVRLVGGTHVLTHWASDRLVGARYQQTSNLGV